VLALNTILFPDEVVDASSIPDLPERRPAVGDKELKIARSLIESLSTSFKPTKYEDTYRVQVLEMIERKAKGEEIVMPEEPEEKAEVVDLLAALEASIEAAKKGKSTSSTKSTKPTSKPTAKRRTGPGKKAPAKKAVGKKRTRNAAA
jgi:DNA end-binding protein Ku